jgi:ferrochelatase
MLAYQSRSGDPSEAWLEPTVESVVGSLPPDRDADVLFIPLGFALDHREVLFDLDRKARSLVESRGFHYHRSRTAGDHPNVLGFLARRAEEALA